MVSGRIVSASGIRGVVGPALNAEVAARYAAAFATELRDRPEGHVIVGRDSRVSGPVLAAAVAAGLRGAGRTVVDLGIVTTPTGLLAVQDDDEAVGGVLVTASHNPAEWNGLKLAAADGTFVAPERGREVQSIAESGVRWAAADRQGDLREREGAAARHVDRVLALPLLVADRVRDRGFHVALDTVRGAAGPIMARLLERLGCRVEGLDLETDGRFPRDPEPRPENLGRLGERVRETGAELGIAVDPDGDRLALVDAGGRPVGEDLTLALAARYVLARRKGVVVTNLSTSRVVEDVVRAAGGEVALAPVGEAHVARRMREVDAVVGGEGNGGVMLPDLHLTRDAPVAAALVLGALAEAPGTLRDLVDGLPSYRIVKRRIERPDRELGPVYERLSAEAGAGSVADRQDGLRLDWPEERRWVHVRPSGTEPIVRVIAEAPDREGAEELARWAVSRVRDSTSDAES